jgi:hypothetical protein
MKRTLAPCFAVLLMLAACSSTTPAPATEVSTAIPFTDTPVPTAEPTSTPLPTLEPTSTPTSAFPSFPRANCCDGREVEAGEYALPAWFGMPLSIEIDDGWRVLNEEAARLFMLGKGRSIYNDPTQVLVFMPAPDGDPQAILDSIREEPGLNPQGEIAETTIAGFPGLQLDLKANPNPDYPGNEQAEIPPGVQFLPAVNKYFAEGFMWTTWTAEAQLRFIALQVDEDVLLIEIESPPAEFESFASQADEVLQALKR